jgi:hypothetical protein
LSWRLPLQFLLLLLLLALTLGAEKFQAGLEKLADFEKSGGHEKSWGF